MISLEEAKAIILAKKMNHSIEEVDLLSAIDRTLAEDIISQINVPPADCSAMDGFAVTYDDIVSANEDLPVTLKLVGEVSAGEKANLKLWSGEAVQIMTGAPLPEGGEVVVPIENTKINADMVSIAKAFPLQANIRKKGEDIKKGDVVLNKGEILKPVKIGLLAAMGRGRIKVAARPKVAVLATGNELLEPGASYEEGKIYSSNHYTIASQVVKAGGEPVLLGIASDNEVNLRKLIAKGLEYPVFITSGGVSVGKYDLVKKILEESGVKTEFWKVAIKPGKPIVFGTYGNTLVFGLPGFPVASMLCFEHFVRPAIAKMLGREYVPEQIEAKLDGKLKGKGGRVEFIRARLYYKDGCCFVSPLKGQGSGVLSTLSKANSLIIVPPDKDIIEENEKVTVQLLDD